MIVENLHNPRIIVADGGMDGKTQIYDVELFEKLVHTFAYFVKIDHVSKLPIRDSKDLYLLSLCETVPADFILTGDEDLLSVDTKNCNYKIMRFNDFMIKILSNS